MSQKVPKVDYSKGLIYKLCCKDATIEDIYIGSTTNFTKRKHKHKYDCYNLNKIKTYNRILYKCIRENGGFENWDMILIEFYSCNNKKELEAKERKYIEELKPTLNFTIPTRTKEEWYQHNKYTIIERQKHYYENNKDKKKQYHKEYQLNHKEKLDKYKKEYYDTNKTIISEKSKIKIECNFCKSLVCKKTLKRHQTSLKCLKFQKLYN